MKFRWASLLLLGMGLWGAPAPAEEVATPELQSTAQEIEQESAPADAAAGKRCFLCPTWLCKDGCCLGESCCLGLDKLCGACDGMGDAPGQFRGGVGFYWIRPSWNSNPSFARFMNGGNVAINQLNTFNYDFSFSPRVWAGYVNKEGMGVRTRYWNYEQGRTQIASSQGDIITATPLGIGYFGQGAAGAPVNINFDSQLRLYAIDLDVVKDIPIGNLTLIYWGGFRYAHIYQNYSALESGAANNQFLASGQNMNGFGPTVGLEDRYKVGDSGLSLFGNIRGSLLFGNGKQNVSRQSTVLGNITSTEAQNNLMPIAELEVGGEFAFDLGPAKWVIQLALVGQAWYGVGNSSRTSGIDATSTLLPFLAGGMIPPNSAADNNNLGFYGLTASTGVRW